MTDLMILNPSGYESYERQFERIGIDRTCGFDAGRLDRDTIAGLNRAGKGRVFDHCKQPGESGPPPRQRVDDLYRHGRLWRQVPEKGCGGQYGPWG